MCEEICSFTRENLIKPFLYGLAYPPAKRGSIS